MKFKWIIIIAIIVIFGWAFFFVKMSSAPPKPTHKTLEQQFKEDPSTWDSAEQQQYQDYLEWLAKQTPTP